MSKIIAIHSFRRSTGKSTIAANLAALLALAGHRVGVVDANVSSPGLHWLFGLGHTELDGTLNDFLLGRQPIEQAAHDLTVRLGADARGRLFLVPASDDALQLAQVLRERNRSDRMGEGYQKLIEYLRLDVLVVDTQPGLDQDSLAAMAMSDVLLLVLRLDQQDYQGTAVMVDVARQFKVADLSLLANLVSESYEPGAVVAQLEQTYHCPVAAVLPLSEDLMGAPGESLFVIDHPRHPVTALLRQTAARLAPQASAFGQG
jgi:MinD-like ATPase involved in chromosome partitioning or flagellar assembly